MDKETTELTRDRETEDAPAPKPDFTPTVTVGLIAVVILAALWQAIARVRRYLREAQ